MSGISPLLAVAIAAALIALSAFFVAIEFALIAARRYRLEELARTSRSARAALRSARDLSLLLAGSQLGITLCTLGLGAVAKPAVQDGLQPLLQSAGLPTVLADVLAFALALIVVTFLHLVVGEMAPKSWAISHPEESAVLLALPMRAFLRVTRPLLVALNGMANWCLHRFGVEAVDELAGGRNAQTLRELVDHSAEAGSLEPNRRDQLLTTLELDTAQLRTLIRPIADVSGVGAADPVRRIREVAQVSGHLRLVVWQETQPVGVVHVRDALDVNENTTADDLKRPLLMLPPDLPVHRAMTTMRRRRSQFAMVSAADGQLLGVVTMQDVLDRLLPREQHTSSPQQTSRPLNPGDPRRGTGGAGRSRH